MVDLIGELKLPLRLHSSVKILNIRNELVCIYCNSWLHILALGFGFEEINESDNPQASTSNNVAKQKVFVKTKVSYNLPSEVLNVTITDSTLHILTTCGIVTQTLEDGIEKEEKIDDVCEVDKNQCDVIRQITNVRYKKRNAHSLASLPDELIICCKELIHNAWLVELLHQGCHQPHRKENCLFSVAYDRYNFEEDFENHRLTLDPFENQIPLPKNEPILLCIATRRTDVFYSHLCILEKELFISLFATPESVNNVIVLLALPDGKVVWYPMTQNLSNKFSSPYLLCDLSQPIVAVFCSNVKHTQECANSITVIGSEGKVVIFATGKDKHGHHALFGQLESSLQSCIMWKNFVIYISLDSHLCGCEIILTESNEHSLSFHCYRLPISGACAACFITEGTNTKVLCLNLAGYLYTLPFCSSSIDDSISDSRDIQSVLKSISDNAREVSHQQSFIKLQKQVLSQLGMALDLKFKTQTVENFPFTMEKVKGQKDAYTLGIDCSSLSRFDFNTEWWSFIVTVKSKRHISCCKSIPVGSNSVLHLVLNICRDEVSSSLCPPFLIEYGLLLQFSSSKQDFAEFLKKRDPIYVCISQDTIDELCFLTVEKGDDTPTIPQTISIISKMKAIRQCQEKNNAQQSSNLSHSEEMQNSILFSLQRAKLPENKNNKNTNVDGAVKPQDILMYLAQKSLVGNFQVLSNSLLCYYFGVKVQIEVQNKEEHMQVSIHSEDRAVVCKLRKAILFRIKDLLSSDKLQNQRVSLSKMCLVQCQRLYLELCSIRTRDLTIESLAELYNKIRKEISQCLPIV